MKKKKSLGTRITLAVMLVMAYGILSAGITGMVCLNKQSQSEMKNSMAERVSSAANLVSSTVSHYSEMIAILDGTTAQANNIIATDSAIVEINTRSTSSPGITTNDEGYIVITAAYAKGVASITTNTEWLVDVMNTMHTSESTEFYLLNSSGSIMASMNGTLAAEDISKYLESSKMQTANIGGKSRVIYSTNIPNTDWTAFVSCDESEFTGNSLLALLIMIGSTAVCFAVGAVIIRRFVRRIIDPLQTVNDKILDMAAGNLSSGSVEVYTGDEIQTLAEAVNSMADYTEAIINDIKNVAAKIAAEDLTVDPEAEYIGDYIPIRDALYGIINSTSNVVSQIEVSSRQVSEGSANMSDNSTTLSHAAAEQAATIEELNASIVEISDNITANAESAARAKTLADDCRAIVDQGNVKMNDMVRAMEEINETSAQIANIIKTIEDISFQTNILSLNASIEAARAGEAGKGFAVVAGEVGQLAGKTAEAAKNTTSLIKTALVAVENGTVMANATAKMLKKIVTETDDTAKVIDQIAAASQIQADSVKQILVGMDQISNSVQMTSGSSAECAASAEELSGQAKVLLELVQNFKVAPPSRRRRRHKPAAAADTTAPAATTTTTPDKTGKPDVTAAPAEVPAEKPADAPAGTAENTAATEKKEPEKKADKPEKPSKKTKAKDNAKEVKAEVKPQSAEKPAEKSAKPAPAEQPKQEKKPETEPATDKKPAEKPAAEKPAAKPTVKPSAKPEAKAEPPKRTIVLDDDKY
ncbi:MAG: methyl-accepting chemotaxis protein [Oscillospiraceae bacterium]